MVEEYCRSLLKVAVAQLCQGLGWHAIHTTPCDLLTDVLQRYLEHLARHSHRYAEQYGRTDPNLDDVSLAFSHMHVRLNEFETYLKEVEPIPFAHPLPSFPVAKRNNLQIPQPGSRDCRERLEYIPEHMPPLVDIAGEFGEGLDAMDVSSLSRMSFDADSCEPHTPLMSPTSPRGEKRELLSPTDYFAFKRLRMMDDGTPRELTAISMGVNGEITPKREGRLPVALTPPQKPLVERRSGVVPVSRLESRIDGLLLKGSKSPCPPGIMDSKSSKGKGITPPKPKPKSPKHLFFSSGGTPSVFQVKPKSPAVVIMDKVKELMPSGSKNIKVMGPNIGTLLITTKKTESPALQPAQASDDDKSPSPKKPSALDVYDFEDEDTKPRPSKTFDPCGELPDPSKAVLPSAMLIRDDEEEVVANAASIEDTIESVISKMAQSKVPVKTGKKNGKDGERERTKEKGKEKSKEKGKDRNTEKGKGGLLDMANKSNQDKSSSKGHSLPPKLLFKHAWQENEGEITSAVKLETSPGLALRLLIKTGDSKDKSKDRKDKLKKVGEEKSSGKESKKERSKRKKEQLKKEKLKRKKVDKKRKLQELAGKAASSSGAEMQTETQKQPTIAKLNIITKNPKLMKVRMVSQSDSASSSPSRDKSSTKQPKDKNRLKKKRKEKERKAKVKAAQESLKKAKEKEGSKKPGEKRIEEGPRTPEEPTKLAKLTVPKLMLKIASASSTGEATKIIIKKQSENPKPPPARTRSPSPSSSSSSASPSPPPPRQKSAPPSPSPRSPSPRSPSPRSPSPRSPSPRSPSPPSRSPSPPLKKAPAPRKAPAAKKSSLAKKVPAASPPRSPSPVPKSPPSPPKSPPPPKVPVTVPPVRKAASKAFSAIAKPTKVTQPLSPGTSQPPAPFKGISVPTKASLKAPVEKPSTSKGGGKAAASQKAPGTPPPSGGVTVGGSTQRSVSLETVGTVVSDTGIKIWICPNCKLPDDGSPMVGCDTCDDWYHWPCVGIKEEPKEDNWYCPRCRVPKKKKGKKKYK